VIAVGAIELAGKHAALFATGDRNRRGHRSLRPSFSRTSR